MTQPPPTQTWTAVDHYLADALLPPDPALDACLAASAAAGLPDIQVSPLQGRLLSLLVTMSGAKSILEIGTLGGYSTIHLARALPAGGRVVTLEADARHADVAKANLARAGLTDVVDVWVGLALDTLAKLAADRATFDFVFIDADKANNAAYVDWALRLTRPGGVVVVDNVIRDGHVADAASTDLSVQGTRRMFDLIKSDPRVTATAVQTVGAKGYDGFVVAVVRPGA